MAEKVVTDEVALKCYQVLEAIDTVEQLADEAFNLIKVGENSMREGFLRLGFHNLRVHAQSWKANCFIDDAIITQAKEQLNDEF